MAKVIRKLVVEDNTNFESIGAFKTEHYVGFWEYQTEQFMFFTDEEEKWVVVIPECADLEELDEKVFEATNEHILEVFNQFEYKIKLEIVEVKE